MGWLGMKCWKFFWDKYRFLVLRFRYYCKRWGLFGSRPFLLLELVLMLMCNYAFWAGKTWCVCCIFWVVKVWIAFCLVSPHFRSISWSSNLSYNSSKVIGDSRARTNETISLYSDLSTLRTWMVRSSSESGSLTIASSSATFFYDLHIFCNVVGVFAMKS